LICSQGALTATPLDGSTGGPCWEGHFCSAGTSVPHTCPPSTFSNVTHGESINDCFECPEGFYCEEHATTTPAPCSSGYYCPTNTTVPTYVCPAGTHCPTGTAVPQVRDTEIPAFLQFFHSTRLRAHFVILHGVVSLAPLAHIRQMLHRSTATRARLGTIAHWVRASLQTVRLVTSAHQGQKCPPSLHARRARFRTTPIWDQLKNALTYVRFAMALDFPCVRILTRAAQLCSVLPAGFAVRQASLNRRANAEQAITA
jgi:hypothetical protein